ncbi:MAG: transketolase [Candidatus Sungbacteria bacterium RIFCSPLOWO2_02_FULL_54_10]|uniref:Transketolase n=2 Tax=Candidatus Sungiibacteriota TaxID=1817917 RepID=A0A1G2L7W0_9BACT|nr:MAG: transketolase [Candidatus Sungbacteria bacterium RIFCSPHIGHO2_01_FULL_54_26]OHA03043.1 MAG: transketolase [Candidatus Sungbacteria bacterium RIFCSPHIGHO2_02_FULL_53_17]OHA06901.1 MAG: transketolase [Candidatus Sungbacteria bacterium RIFCSPLOWO2_01_FULL_54_21]OHA12929.1 MAG: transketolase [Candidatus Sungbacteria bacterium RIFCSPLOWO2_02_FULL_54_10]
MPHLHEDKIKFLEEMANQIRQDVIAMVSHARSGHIAGPLGMADIFAALYFHILRHDPKHPEWSERDRLILSNGHICPVRYAAMARAGYFPVEELKTLRTFGSRLQGHPHRTILPGVETTSGPLGSGLSQAVGMAIVAKMDAKKINIYCLMSDGEQECGQTWEAAMLAGKLKLDNLTALIDRNNIQIDGMTEDIMPLEPLRQKYEAFGWHVLDINGHNFEEIANAYETAQAIYEKPVLIIAHTIPGKGVDFMEFEYPWHSKTFKPEEAKESLAQLRTLQGKIKSEHE